MKNTIVAGIILYFVSTGVSYVAFANIGKGGGLLSPTNFHTEAIPTPDPSNRIVIAPEAPKNQACPLNGKMYTEAEKQSWDVRRPLAVMVENHVDARPQSGLSKADVVYEAVVEGGITRFMAMYYCEAQAKDVLIAPVRSARQAFIDWAFDYNLPLYVHVGGANGDDTDPRVRALEHLSDYGWTMRNDLNQFSLGYPTFVRNYNRLPGKDDLATEHTMESSTERLWAISAKRGYTNLSPDVKLRGKVVPGKDWRTGFVEWMFQDDAEGAKRGTVSTVSNEFWSGYKEFDVKWIYDKAANMYKRFVAEQSDVDLSTSKQIEVKNVVIMQVKELSSIDIHHHNYLQTIGTGKAWVFQNGEAVQATWTKKTRDGGRLIFTDSRGKQIQFVRGMIWISAVNQEVAPAY